MNHIDLDRLLAKQQETGRAMMRRLDAIREAIDALQWDIEQAYTMRHPLVLLRHVDVLGLETLTRNALVHDGIVYIGDLVQRTRPELMKVNYLGKIGIDRIEQALDKLELALGTRLEDWPPPILDLVE